MELVLDASVIGRWFGPSRDAQSATVRTDFEAGRLVIVVPRLLFLELLNVAGRQRRWAETQLLGLVSRLVEARFEVVEPDLRRVAAWTARGLTTYDATYVALAEERGIPLVTNDREILRIAGEVARPVSPR
ncbi:MAG TPA: type II toxin-antitoxin system VapC family toxin [Candidatus Limnocylindria bacterium]|nr:type II toxin-antitoxin system VapC family toxin [Candidatus Limnocylindria bacterium]